MAAKLTTSGPTETTQSNELRPQVQSEDVTRCQRSPAHLTTVVHLELFGSCLDSCYSFRNLAGMADASLPLWRTCKCQGCEPKGALPTHMSPGQINTEQKLKLTQVWLAKLVPPLGQIWIVGKGIMRCHFHQDYKGSSVPSKGRIYHTAAADGRMDRQTDSWRRPAWIKSFHALREQMLFWCHPKNKKKTTYV